MKRCISFLLILSLLAGCADTMVSPNSAAVATASLPAATSSPSATIAVTPSAPASTATPVPALATFAPRYDTTALFAEELLSQDGEPLGSSIRSLLEDDTLTKAEFLVSFQDIIDCVDRLEVNALDLSNQGRTLTKYRQAQTVNALTELMSPEIQEDLRSAYSSRSGAGADLPMTAYTASLGALLQDVQRMEERTEPFFRLDKTSAQDYLTVLSRYMGETVSPRDVFSALEVLAQTEAYALADALQMDPEAARKKEPISFGGFTQNMAFLRQITEDLCPLPDGARLSVPYGSKAEQDMDLLELAFRLYPGMAYFKVYAAHSSEDQHARWANASEGYLAGLAVHCSYAVVPYLDSFGLDYVRYRWYEDMLDVTLTGLSSLLIHYYGYSASDLAAYLKGWGAEEFASYLYDRAMIDPFESLVAAYGYWRYLDICQAALDAGCPDEKQFLREYLSAGPAPFEALKEYMVSLYQKQG